MSEKVLNAKKVDHTEKRKKLGLPVYSTLEEILNAITHGIGAVLSISAVVLLVVFSDFNPKTIICVTIYSSTLFLLYVVSTMYHALSINRAKKVFQVLDHCSIFLLIWGTYTPICLLMIRSVVGWILFSVVLLAAIVGITLNSIDLKKFSKFSMICYISMGWVVVFAVKPLISSLSSKHLLLLLFGGIAYTVGAVIYAFGKKIKYMHSVWHLFVLLGSIFHFFMIFDFVKVS